MRKNLPPSTLDALRPPDIQHQYFADWQTHLFQETAATFELANAWWLAEMALLAYASDGFITETFANTGLAAAGFRVQCFSHASAQCFVAHTPQVIFLAFRGTEVDNFWGSVMDWATDLR